VMCQALLFRASGPVDARLLNLGQRRMFRVSRHSDVRVPQSGWTPRPWSDRQDLTACLLVLVDVSPMAGWSVDDAASSGCLASRPVENSKQESGCSDDHQRNPPVAA
jgi:hypothetical protein